MAEKEPRIDVTVMVDDAHRSSLPQVAKLLKAKGFVLGQSLAEIGVLTGSAPAAQVAGLSSVAGVASVEKSQSDYRPQ